MLGKKIKLENIKVESFITTDEAQNIYGASGEIVLGFAVGYWAESGENCEFIAGTILDHWTDWEELGEDIGVMLDDLGFGWGEGGGGDDKNGWAVAEGFDSGLDSGGIDSGGWLEGGFNDWGSEAGEGDDNGWAVAEGFDSGGFEAGGVEAGGVEAGEGDNNGWGVAEGFDSGLDSGGIDSGGWLEGGGFEGGGFEGGNNGGDAGSSGEGAFEGAGGDGGMNDLPTGCGMYNKNGSGVIKVRFISGV